jgi:transposase
MEKIPKQEYTTEFKERAVKHVKEGKSIGLSAKETWSIVVPGFKTMV